MADYGRGINLDENFDIRLTSAGDVDVVDGRTEFEKDLAYQLVQVFDEKSADPFSKTGRAEIGMLVDDTLLADARVQEVTSVSVSIPNDRANAIILDVSGTGDEGPFDFVQSV